MNSNDTKAQGCGRCDGNIELDLAFSFAFQPIVDVRTLKTHSYEALVRGSKGEGAYSVLSQVTSDNRYQFDQQCRVKAVTLAQQLGVDCKLNINFYPNAVYEPAACIRTTVNTADAVGFPVNHLVFEFVESEEIQDRCHLKKIVADYQSRGMCTAIDDFGAGYASLNVLTDYTPNYLKVDMHLVRDIDSNRTKQLLVNAITDIAEQLNIRVICEGIETEAEARFLADRGVFLQQGYFFAKPLFEGLPPLIDAARNAFKSNQV